MSDEAWKESEELDKILIQKKRELLLLLEKRKKLHRNLSRRNGDVYKESASEG